MIVGSQTEAHASTVIDYRRLTSTIMRPLFRALHAQTTCEIDATENPKFDYLLSSTVNHFPFYT